EVEFIWRDLEVLGEVTNALEKRKTRIEDTGVMMKKRRTDPVSVKICEDLIKPFDVVPRGVKDLLSIINTLLACKLPVSVDISSKALHMFVNMSEADRECQLATHVTYILSETITWRCTTVNKSEDMLHIPIDLLIGNTLEMFRECLGILFNINRNQSDIELTTKDYYHPDFICKLKRAVVLKGEEKASVEDLNLALVIWSINFTE
ncbi:8545_t:CDS:1, partial [Dentiscutata erythropus]